MKALLVVFAFAGGVFAASNIQLTSNAGSSEVDGGRASRVSSDKNPMKATEESLEDRLVKTFKNLWSVRVENDTLYLSLDIPEGIEIDGCDYVEHGFEVYSVASLSAGSGRLYLEGGAAIKGSRSASDNKIDLKQLRELLSVSGTQRALVVRFWIAPKSDSKIRYLVGERLWDDSW